MLRQINNIRKGYGAQAFKLALPIFTLPRRTLSQLKRAGLARSRQLEGLTRAQEVSEARARRGPAPRSAKDAVDMIGQKTPLLVLDERPNEIDVGATDVDIAAILRFSAMSFKSCRFRIDGTSVEYGAGDFWLRCQSARTASVSFATSDGFAHAINILVYVPGASGRWTSRDHNNPILRSCDAGVFRGTGVSYARELLGGPVLSDLAWNAPVDAVFTWVNHDDPNWKALYADAKGGEDANLSDANAMSRFRNNDELRYAMRSLADNLPWLRKIHVFSNCNPPDWLDTAHEKIEWVRHEDVIPAEYLPTFNSHVIESYLHRIPGVAERFIYLNDDFFVMRSMKPSDFFAGSGQSLSRLEPSGMVSGSHDPDDPDYLNAARNCVELIHSRLGFVPTQLHRHAPFSLKRSVLDEIEACWAERYAQFRCNAFRGREDLNVPSFLYHHYAIGTGQALSDPKKTVLVKSNDPATQASRMNEAMNADVDFVCLNEGGVEAPSEQWVTSTRHFMLTKFPLPAPWEHQYVAP